MEERKNRALLVLVSCVSSDILGVKSEAVINPFNMCAYKFLNLGFNKDICKTRYTF